MKTYGVIALVVVLALVGVGIWYTSQPAAAPTEGEIEIQVKIGDAATTLVTVPHGATALDVTRAAAEVTTQGEGELAFVTAIDGVVPNEDKQEFWKLVVNGADAPVGAGSYRVQPGDTIAWELDTY